MDLETGMRNYARVLVQVGMALEPGQMACIEAPVEAAGFVELLTEEVYASGGSKAAVIWKSDKVDRIRLDHQTMEYDECDLAVARYYAEHHAGYIRLDYPDFETYSGVSADKINQKALADRMIRNIFQSMGGGQGQTIACIPNQSWAAMVFPELPEEKRLEALWEAVLTCVRCNTEDPVASWRKYIEDAGRRKAYLTGKKYQAFHYRSTRTDLILRPAKDQVWIGGCMNKSSGGPFVPNIPTEEVFTTPDKYGADGYVGSTLPLNYKGQFVEDFVLHLEKGRIIQWHAKKGQEILDAIIGTDEGSSYLGEMAFVDQASPIAAMNKIFYTTLFDENASCHLAIGNAYGPSDPGLKEEMGYNDSSVHVDFMIGSDDMNIQGMLLDGTWEDVFIDGHWV